MTHLPILPTLPIAALIDHLWQSTAVGLLVWLLTCALRNNRASARYRLWLLASVKFLLPFSLLISAGSALRPTTYATIEAHPLSRLVTQAVQPYAQSASVLAQQPSSTASAARNRLLGLCLLAWACGTGALTLAWLRSWSALRRTARSARLCMQVSGVPVLATESLLEPGVFGIVHPVLLVPESLLDRLSNAQLQAIFAHELCHIRRRDNLTAAVHMAVQAVFWFHPGVWFIQRRLLEERERACDEAVLDSGNDAEVYAESLVNVSRFYLESPLATMAGITGGDLKQRVIRIMTEARYTRLSLGAKLTLAAAGLFAVSLPFTAGLIHGDRVHAQTEKPLPSFEVASIRPDKSGSNDMSINATKAVWQCKNAPLITLLWSAFDVKDFQVLSVPGWVKSERYTVEAKVPEETQSLPDEQRYKQADLMLQSLLKDRFYLSYHWITRQLPVYSLVIAKGGTKLPTAKPDEKGGEVVDDTYIETRAFTMNDFARQLSATLNQTVMDKTGLAGKYTFTLHYPPPQDLGAANGVSQSSATEKQARIFSALQDQLGLKLIAEKGPVQMLVIDSIDRPTPN